MVWLEEHRVFIECYVAVQRAFRKKFKLKRHYAVASCFTICEWVKTFWETNAATSVAVGRKRSVQTVENCEKLRVVVEVTVWTSFCQHSSSLHFSHSIEHQMLKHDLGYHPYKLSNFVRWKDFCKLFLRLQLQDDTKLFFYRRSTLQIEWVCKQTFASGQMIIQIGRLHNFCILNRSQCGALFHSTAS